MLHTVKIKNKTWLNHDVTRLTLEKPELFSSSAGQAIEVTLDNPRFSGENAPFTLTSLNGDKDLELILKVYPARNGMTLEISKLNKGDHLIITDAWNSYKNRGPGMFIAGGTGVTPFIAILRQLEAENRIAGSTLIFANKTEKDIFLREEFTRMLGKNFVNILSREKKENFLYGHIDSKLLKNQITRYNQPFYICGPDNFAKDIRNLLLALDVNSDLIDIGS